MLRWLRSAAVAALVVIAGALPSRAAAPFTISVAPTSGEAGTFVAIDLPTTAAYGFTGTVQFAGTSARTIADWPAGSAYMSVPAGAESGPVTVTVITPPQDNTLGWVAGETAQASFTVPPPAVTSVAAQAATGTACTVFAVGETVTVIGTGFGNAQGSSAVLIDGNPDSAVGWYAAMVGGPHETLTVTLPSNIAAGRHTLAVRTGGGTSNAVPIETGPATSDGCGSTVASPPGTGSSAGGGSGSGGRAPSPEAPPVPVGGSTTTHTPAPAPTPSPSSPGPTIISGPASLGVGGQAAYALLPASTAAIHWDSSDPAIATVSSHGVVTAHHAGSVTLSAISGDHSAAKLLTVIAAAPGNGESAGKLSARAKPTRGARVTDAMLAGVLLLLSAVVLLLVAVRRRRWRRNQDRQGKVS